MTRRKEVGRKRDERRKSKREDEGRGNRGMKKEERERRKVGI